MTAITPVIPGIDLPVTKMAEHQEEYITLPCHRHHDGTVTIHWKLSWRERFEVFFGGSIWHKILTFNQGLQPIELTTRPTIRPEWICPR